MTRKTLRLLVIGLFIISLSQIIARFTPLGDFIHGAILGAGIRSNIYGNI